MIVSDEEFKEMTEENKKEYCEWCWHHDYGDCDLCAIHKSRLIRTYL